MTDIGKRTIGGFLAMSRQALQAAHIDSYLLDSELLLADTLSIPREWLLAHDDAEIASAEWTELCRRLYLRCQHCPLAYITGHKQFYGQDFLVTPDVLIPRPESEQLIESLSKLLTERKLNSDLTIVDVGTGSGCLAITAKLLYPNLSVIATDISKTALVVAENNAHRLLPDGQQITFLQGNLLSNLPGKIAKRGLDIVIANLPYVERDWPDLSPELDFEPAIALYDDTDDGLGITKKLIDQSKRCLKPGGYLIIEVDSRQINQLIDYTTKSGYQVIDKKPFTITFKANN